MSKILSLPICPAASKESIPEYETFGVLIDSQWFQRLSHDHGRGEIGGGHFWIIQLFVQTVPFDTDMLLLFFLFVLEVFHDTFSKTNEKIRHMPIFILKNIGSDQD